MGRKQDYDDDDPNDKNGNNGQDDRPADVFPPHFAVYLSRRLLKRRSLKYNCKNPLHETAEMT